MRDKRLRMIHSYRSTYESTLTCLRIARICCRYHAIRNRPRIGPCNLIAQRMCGDAMLQIERTTTSICWCDARFGFGAAVLSTDAQLIGIDGVVFGEIELRAQKGLYGLLGLTQINRNSRRDDDDDSDGADRNRIRCCRCSSLERCAVI